MNVKDLRNLYDYGYWANGKLFEALFGLTPEEFTREVAGSYGSIRNTLVHAMSAEWGWLERCGGHARGPRLNPEDYPTLESLVEAWSGVERHVREFLSGLKDEDLSREVEFPNPGGQTRSMTVGELMQHAANHSVHHRGQAALLLRMMGHAPGYLDLLVYYAEQRGFHQTS